MTRHISTLDLDNKEFRWFKCRLTCFRIIPSSGPTLLDAIGLSGIVGHSGNRESPLGGLTPLALGSISSYGTRPMPPRAPNPPLPPPRP